MQYSFHYKSAIASLCQGMCLISYVCMMGGVGGYNYSALFPPSHHLPDSLC